MAHVVCLLNVSADRATFTWSEGPASFEPYELSGQVFQDFKAVSSEVREKLSNLVKDYVYGEENVPRASFELAAAGWELYQQIFDPGAGQRQSAVDVQKWLEGLRGESDVDTLEIVVDSPWAIPWNVIYDEEPDERAFLESDEGPARWSPFWGIRYDLTGGRKVNPLRRAPSLSDPKVLMVVDPKIRDGLPRSQQKRLAEFCENYQIRTVSEKDELIAETKAQRPHLLYWLSHATPSALVLGEEEITPRQLRKLFRRDESSDPYELGGIAFLNACQTAESGESGSFFDALHSVGFTGMVGTEHQTVDTFANPLGLDFLEAFLVRGEPVGSIMRQLRCRVPLGLVYGTYCPPSLRVVNERDTSEPPTAQEDLANAEQTPVMLSAATLVRTYPPLPDDPYRSLAYYSYNDQALFAGREDDVQGFATLLDDNDVRIVVLHGESGVGKSSFLRAGVIPYLEDECVGYRFVREQLNRDTNEAVLFVRATNDLAGQMAQALTQFCSQPFTYPTPAGNSTEVNLPELLSESSGGHTESAHLREALLNDPGLLGRILSTIGDRLPFAPVLVIDQCEEIFTLAQTMEDIDNRELALAMLRRLIHLSGDFKIVLSLRTEYYGRLLDRLRRGVLDTTEIREYLLTDFSEEGLVEAISRPTESEPIRRSAEIPYAKYGFRYAEGVPEEIARRVIHFSVQQRDSVLPLMQVICNQLYQRVQDRDDKEITSADLDALGGIEGGMREHVESQMDDVLSDRPSDKRRLKQMLTHLYIRQPDGSLTTALVAEEDVARRWRGRMPFPELVAKAERLRLMRVNTLRIGGEQEKRYLSLGHDALAKLAAAWHDELSRGARLRRMATIVGVVSSVAVVMLLLFVQARFERRTAEQARDQSLRDQVAAEFARDQADAATANAMRARDEANATVDKYFTRVSNNTLLNAPGMQELRRELLGEAREHYEKYADRDSDDARLQARKAMSYFNLGRIAEGEDRFDEAIWQFSRAIEIQQQDSSLASEYSDSLNGLGIAFDRQRRFAEAIDAYGQAAIQRQKLVDVALRDGTKTTAKQLQAVEFELKLANTYMNIGLTLREMRPAEIVGLPDSSREFLQNEGSEELRGPLEFFQAANDTRTRQKEVLQALADQDPGNSNLRSRIGNICRDLGKGFFSQALFAAKNPELAATADQHYRDAIANFDQALKEASNDMDVQFVKGLCHRAYGEFRYRTDAVTAREQYLAARSSLERLVFFNPEVPRYRREMERLGLAFRNLGIVQYQGNRADLNSPLENFRSAEELLAQLETQFPGQHRHRLEETRDLIKRFQSYKLRKLRELLYAKDFASGLKLADELAAEHWEDGRTLNQIAWMLVTEVDDGHKDLEQAMRIAERASELQDNANDATLDTVARIYFEQGDLEQAIAWQKKAVEHATTKNHGQLAENLREYEAAVAGVEPRGTSGEPPETP